MKTTAPLTMIWRMMRQGGWWYVSNLSVIVVIVLIELLPGLINRQVLNDLQSQQQMSIPWLMLAALLGITVMRVMLLSNLGPAAGEQSRAHTRVKCRMCW